MIGIILIGVSRWILIAVCMSDISQYVLYIPWVQHFRNHVVLEMCLKCICFASVSNRSPSQQLCFQQRLENNKDYDIALLVQSSDNISRHHSLQHSTTTFSVISVDVHIENDQSYQT